MNKKEEKGTPSIAFPKDYDYLNETIAHSLERYDEISRQLEEYAKAPQSAAKPYQLEFRPPEAGRDPKPINWAFRMEKLNEEKTQLASRLTDHIDWQLQMTSADEATMALVKEAVDRRLHPNPYEGISGKEAQKASEHPKELEQSQDWMRERLVRFRNPASKEKEENPLDASQKIMQGQLEHVRMKGAKEETKESPTLSMSAKFTLGLSYSKVFTAEEPGTPSDKKVKEDPSPEKQ